MLVDDLPFGVFGYQWIGVLYPFLKIENRLVVDTIVVRIVVPNYWNGCGLGEVFECDVIYFDVIFAINHSHRFG